MDFQLSDDDNEVVGFARSTLTGIAGLARLRDRQAEWSAWPGVAAAGWFDAGVSGDAALPVLVSIAREAGRVAAVDQFVNNGWILPRLLAAAGDSLAQEPWRERLLTRPGAVMGGELVGGRRAPVAFGAGPGYDLYVVSEDADEVVLQRVGHDVVGFTPLAGLSFGLATVAPPVGDRLAVVLSASDREELLNVARLLHAAGCAGVAAEMMARTVEHVTSRYQFGHALGQFQAVKHMCADAHAESEVAWLAILYASIDQAEASSSIDQAAVLSARALATASRVSSQLQGAMGFTWESDLHLLLKASLDAQARFTTSGALAQRLGENLLAAS